MHRHKVSPSPGTKACQRWPSSFKSLLSAVRCLLLLSSRADNGLNIFQDWRGTDADLNRDNTISHNSLALHASCRTVSPWFLRSCAFILPPFWTTAPVQTGSISPGCRGWECGGDWRSISPRQSKQRRRWTTRSNTSFACSHMERVSGKSEPSLILLFCLRFPYRLVEPFPDDDGLLRHAFGSVPRPPAGSHRVRFVFDPRHSGGLAVSTGVIDSS